MEETANTKTLKPKRPRIHGFKMTGLKHYTGIKITKIGLNFTSLESVKNIACVGDKIDKIE